MSEIMQWAKARDDAKSSSWETFEFCSNKNPSYQLLPEDVSLPTATYSIYANTTSASTARFSNTAFMLMLVTSFYPASAKRQ